MKRVLKWLGIVLGTVLILLIIGLAALPFVFPLEKIKDFAVARLSETIHREVRIEKVTFNIFSGIRLEKLSIGNRAGWAPKPFISADAIELRYAFWPLFTRQILIKEISLVAPQILVEKRGADFNYSDLVGRKPNAERRKPSTGKETKPPFDLFVSSFSIRGGKIIYVDRGAGAQNEVKDFNVKVSGFALALIKPIDISVAAKLVYQGKNVPLALSGRVGVNLADESLTIPSLSLAIAGEKLSLTGGLKAWKAAPSFSFSASTKKFNLDPLLAIFAAPANVKKSKPSPGELTKTLNRSLASLPANLSLHGKVDLENISIQKFKADRINATLNLRNKNASLVLNEVKIYGGRLTGQASVNLGFPGLSYSVQGLKLEDFNAAPFSNDLVDSFLTKLPDYKELKNKVYGTLDLSASLRGRGVEPQDILANLDADGSLTLRHGELRRLKTLAEVGKMLKSNTLQGDIKFGAMSSEFGVSKMVVGVKSLKIDENDFKLHFKGGIDLNKLAWVSGNRLTLKLSPATTKDLPEQFVLFRDKTGWLELTFEITGGLKLPLPKPILDKPFEAAVGKLRIKVEAKKVEIEQKAKEEAGQVLEEQKKKLEAEAKKRLKDLIKF